MNFPRRSGATGVFSAAAGVARPFQNPPLPCVGTPVWCLSLLFGFGVGLVLGGAKHWGGSVGWIGTPRLDQTAFVCKTAAMVLYIAMHTSGCFRPVKLLSWDCI